MAPVLETLPHFATRLGVRLERDAGRAVVVVLHDHTGGLRRSGGPQVEDILALAAPAERDLKARVFGCEPIRVVGEDHDIALLFLPEVERYPSVLAEPRDERELRLFELHDELPHGVAGEELEIEVIPSLQPGTLKTIGDDVGHR